MMENEPKAATVKLTGLGRTIGGSRPVTGLERPATFQSQIQRRMAMRTAASLKALLVLALASATQAEGQAIHGIGEYGSMLTPPGDQWHTLTLSRTYQDPVVFAQLATYNGVDPSHVRVRNVTPTSFDFRIEEWGYTSSWHAEETVSYLVVEKGAHQLTDGTKLEVGTRVVDGEFQRVRLFGSYEDESLILTQSQTYNNSILPIITRQHPADTTTFDVKLQHSEWLSGWLKPELVAFLAMEQRAGETDPFTRYRAEILPQRVTDSEMHLRFAESFADGSAAILAAIQTADGPDPVSLRFRWLSYLGDEVWLFLEEEQSYDEETAHAPERIGYLQLSGQGLLHATESPIDGWNVNFVEHGGGSFQNTGDVWLEKDIQGRVKFVFVETHRDDWSVYLYDDSRDMRIQLDLWKGEIYWGLPKQFFASIGNASEALLTTSNPEFISIVGGYKQVTPEELVANYAAQGLILKSFPSLGPGEMPYIGPGECTIVYPSATVQHNDHVLYEHDYRASLGALICALELSDGVMLTQSAIYGGCNLTAYGGGGCEIGVAATELEFRGPITSTVTLNGPRGAYCGNISTTNGCLELDASLVSTSIFMSSNDYGIGVGLSVSVGADVSGRLEGGVLSGSVGLGLGVGASISFSLNLHHMAALGATAFMTTTEGEVIAAEAVVEAYEEVELGIDSAVAASLDGVTVVRAEALSGLEVGAETSIDSLVSVGEEAGGLVVDGLGEVKDAGSSFGSGLCGWLNC